MPFDGRLIICFPSLLFEALHLKRIGIWRLPCSLFDLIQPRNPRSLDHFHPPVRQGLYDAVLY